MASLPGFLCIDGDEVINHCRTYAYMHRGLAPGWSVGGNGDCDCCCCAVDDGDYTTPDDILGNPAPWYDPARPESAQFYGIFLRNMFLSTAYGETAATRPGGRACAKPLPRTLTIEADVVTGSCAATAYAKEWVARALNPLCIDDGCCAERQATLLLWCTPEVEGSCGNEAERYGVDVRMLQLEWEEEGQDTELYCCDGATFTSTLEMEPFLFAESTGCVIEPPWDLDPDSPDVYCFDWNGCGTVCPIPSVTPFNPLDPCSPVVPIPSPPVQVSSCFCEPLSFSRRCCEITKPLPEWTDSVLRITVFAGSKELRNARLRIWQELPTGVEPGSPAGIEDYRCVEACAIAEISRIPVSHSLIIDGRLQSVTLLQPGGGTLPGDNLVFGPSRTLWNHPVILCGGTYWACLDVDIYNTAADATVTIEVIPREIG